MLYPHVMDSVGRVLVDQAALDRLDALVERATTASKMARDDAAFWPEFAAIVAQSRTAVAAIAGRDSDYYTALSGTWAAARTGPYTAGYGAAILTALRDDVQSGYLRRTADLIAAEVFGDFLDMASHLVNAGYHVAAASLVGAVLEDGLRRLARRLDLSVLASDDISALNNRLASKNAYSNLVRKQVDLWSAIRNRADHGEFTEVKAPDVAEMLASVTRFLAERLG